MQRSDALDNYYLSSGKASDIARQLALAGIAIIWIFSGGTVDGSVDVHGRFLWAGVLLIVTLACDLLQYVSGAIAWGIYHRHLEKAGIGDDDEFTAPEQLNWLALAFFATKLGNDHHCLRPHRYRGVVADKLNR